MCYQTSSDILTRKLLQGFQCTRLRSASVAGTEIRHSALSKNETRKLFPYSVKLCCEDHLVPQALSSPAAQTPHLSCKACLFIAVMGLPS